MSTSKLGFWAHRRLHAVPMSGGRCAVIDLAVARGELPRGTKVELVRYGASGSSRKPGSAERQTGRGVSVDPLPAALVSS